MKNDTMKYLMATVAACAALGAAGLAVADDGSTHKAPAIAPSNIYTVTATQALASNSFAPPLAVACHSGDAVLSGSCTQEVDSVAPIAVHASAPVPTGDGWSCTVSNQWSFPATLRVTAVCYGTP